MATKFRDLIRHYQRLEGEDVPPAAWKPPITDALAASNEAARLRNPSKMSEAIRAALGQGGGRQRSNDPRYG